MIKISKQVDYALQLIFELAKLDKDELLSLKKFSNKSSISFLFLQKIARSLRSAGIIKSVKGKHGGYMLNKPADKISVKQIMEAIEGPYGALCCMKNNKCCNKKEKCKMKESFEMINKHLVKYFNKLKVTDIS